MSAKESSAKNETRSPQEEEQKKEKPTRISLTPPEPPEEPDPGDCCGSGCATCVYDIYDQQLNSYKKEVEEFKLKYSLDDQSKKDVEAVLKAAAEERKRSVKLKLLNKEDQGEDDDEDDDSRQNEEEQQSLAPSRYEGSVICSFTRLSPSFSSSSSSSSSSSLSSSSSSSSRSFQVPREHSLTFRMDSSSWNAVEQKRENQQEEEEEFVVDVPFRVSKVIVPSSSSPSRALSLDSRVGAVVEVLRLPPPESIESFLRTFSSQQEREKSQSSSSSSSSSVLLVDLSQFHFVSSPFPNWLQKCNSIMRTSNHSELATSQQTLPVTHLCRTVIDCFSLSAVNRQFLSKLLDIARHNFKNSQKREKEKDLEGQTLIRRGEEESAELAALEALAQMSKSGRVTNVQDFLRFAWQVYSSSSSSSKEEEGGGGGEELKTIREFLSQVDLSVPFAYSLPSALLDYQIPKLRQNEEEEEGEKELELSRIGSVEFVLRLFPLLVRTKFSASEIETDEEMTKFISTAGASSSKKKKDDHHVKFLTFPHLLEILPPLRGRYFSIADHHHHHHVVRNNGEKEEQEEFTFFTNLTNKSGIAYRLPRMPPFSGVVSSVLESSSSENLSAKTQQPQLYLRDGALSLEESSASQYKAKYSASASSSSSTGGIIHFDKNSNNKNFTEALSKLLLLEKDQEEDESKQQKRRDVLFLAAGSGFAPFHFFFESMLRQKTQRVKSFSSSSSSSSSVITKFPSANRRLFLFLGLRVMPLNWFLASRFETYLKQNVVTSVDIAVSNSRTSSSSSSSISQNINDNNNNNNNKMFNVHHNKQVPQLLFLHNQKQEEERQQQMRKKNKSVVDVFSCGMPEFVSSCRRVLELDERVEIASWFNDDW